ncbi:Myb-like_DNA-binding domain-containing protein [Hexamita inflata]|uniref:Myb-like DNA-binding domain-containing protein n=1 Tax=Hexamita inflata TaxID=28002 RepID=A0AA86QLV9_9EUKA|nr:Myb-like DNA-binding domain-containing protein [Hexamita inflata]
MPVIHWTEKEKLLLLEAIDQNKIKNRIQWNAVQNQVQTKSYNQCRTMYSVMLKPPQQAHVNFIWNLKNMILLLVCVLEYGTKWEFIQKNYFPTITSNAIKKKYTKSKILLERLIDILKLINRQQPVELTQKETKILKIVIEFLWYRSSLCNWYTLVIIDSTTLKPEFPIALAKYKNDELEAEPIDIIEGKLYKRLTKYMDFDQMRININNRINLFQ